jgi:hypothetical protein
MAGTRRIAWIRCGSLISPAIRLPTGDPGVVFDAAGRGFICGHLGRLATCGDVVTHQAYIADIVASAADALATVDPVPYFMAGGESAWAGVKGYLDTVTERAAAPVIAKYTGVLAAADIEIFTIDSLRLARLGPVAEPADPPRRRATHYAVRLWPAKRA